MLSTRPSRWVAGAAGVGVLLAAASWFLLVGPRLEQAGRLRDQALAARSQNDTLALQIAQLKSQYADLPKKKAELAAINTEFPAVAQVPTLLRKVNGLAGSAGVVVNSLTPGAAAYLTGADPAAGAAAAADGGGVAGAEALVSIPLSLNVSGDYFQAAQFIKVLQTELDRAFLVTGLTVTQGNSGSGGETSGSTSGSGSATSGEIGLEITGQIFALPDRPAATTAAPAAGASAGASAGNGATNGGTN